jgi:hypothetical protein
MIRIHLLLALSLCFVMSALAAAQAPMGKFLDPLDLRDEKDGVNFSLLADFRYLDPKDMTWLVPKGVKPAVKPIQFGRASDL